MINAISSALAGLSTATQKVNESANNIANAAAGDTDLAEEIVNLNVAEVQYKANLITLDAVNELSEELGRVFDKEV